MKRTITLEKNTLLTTLENEFYSEIEKETKHKVRPSMIKSLLNYSKSLLIIPSSTIKGMSLEIVTN